jgi:dihydrodipicolinate synthase/N-acetylneuraminate lyase
VGKVSRLSEEYTPEQFSVFGGQSDWLLPCLLSGGMGCVTGVGNVFPKCVVHLHSLWKQGKTEEATKLQGVIGQGEKACKEGIAATKFAAGYFTGPAAGLTDSQLFHPRKPYKPAGKDLQNWIIGVMQHLAELEKTLPDAYGPPAQQSNGVK